MLLKSQAQEAKTAQLLTDFLPTFGVQHALE
jgi:hypothetical protein